jgi:hypothetical protein
LDLRGEGRAVRVSAHAEAGFLVLSTWKADECVSTVRLVPDEAAELVAGVAEGLADLACDRAWRARMAGSRHQVDGGLAGERQPASSRAARS